MYKYKNLYTSISDEIEAILKFITNLNDYKVNQECDTCERGCENCKCKEPKAENDTVLDVDDCGETCSCSKDINKNEDYTSSVTITNCDNEDSLSAIQENNGWFFNKLHGEWIKSMHVPVDNNHTEVNILDGERVQVTYEQSYRMDSAECSGYSHMSGSYVFLLPENVNLNTFKVRRQDDYLMFSVSPYTEYFDSTCVKVEIQD